MASHHLYSGTIMQKIEELREWQRQQQEKLLHQQEEQRLLLNNEHQRMYQVFGLQNSDDVCEESVSSKYIKTCNSSLDLHDASNYEDSTIGTTINEDRTTGDIPVAEGHKRADSLDETPIASPRQDFHQLLQEKLEQYGNVDATDNVSKDTEGKPKRKFLRKGEGLARFRMDPVNLQPPQQSNKKNAKKSEKSNQLPRSSNSIVVRKPRIFRGKHEVSASSTNGIKKSDTNTKKSIESVRNETDCTFQPSKSVRSQYPKSAVPKLTLKKTQTSPSVTTWAQILQQNDQDKIVQVQDSEDTQLRMNAMRNSPVRDSIELSFLEKLRDTDKRNKKEVEDLKIFELLEQHAANSSFCSTSSLVARLMESSLNSTPVKNRLQNSSHQNDDFRASLFQPHSSKDAESEKQILLDDPQFPNKNTISGYLPYGLDFADDKISLIRRVGHDNFISGAYDINKDTVTNIAVESANHCETGDGCTSLNTSISSVKTSDGVNSPCSKQLHVRFSEINEYKSISDGDTSFSSQGDTSRNLRCDENSERHKMETVHTEKNRHSKYFQDDQAWSDDCSCTSSDSCKSPNLSLAEIDQSPTKDDSHTKTLQSPDTLSQHHLVNQQYQIYSMVTNTSRLPLDLETSHPLPNCANARVDNQVKTEEIVQGHDEVIFKSSLLRTRLEELEKEIEIFRKENANLQKLRKMHGEEVSKFKKEKKEQEKKMSEEKEKMESLLQEERKKLNRERSVFEKYCKDLKNQPTKKEREEIQSLKKQLADLQEEMHKKDSRWSATQIRTRDRMRQLEQENAQLKSEIEKLKKEKSQTKMVRFEEKSKVSEKPNKTSSATKIIHAINDHIAKIKPSDLEDSIIVHEVVPTKKIPSSVLQQGQNPPQRQAKTKQCNAVRINEWGNVPNKYQTFPAIPDLKSRHSGDEVAREDETSKKLVIKHKASNISNSETKSSVEDEFVGFDESLDGLSYSSGNEESKSRTSPDIIDENKIYTALYEAFYNTNSKSVSVESTDDNSDINSISKSEQSHPMQVLQEPVNKDESTKISSNKLEQVNCDELPEVIYNSDYFSKTFPEQEHAPLTLHSVTSESCQNSNSVASNSVTQKFVSAVSDSAIYNFNRPTKPQNIREKVFPDGRKEILYPNGNLKKISSDGSQTKIIYYNGDVKESLSDGTVKYFYAETKTWHTTYPDGLEILEFPDGQLERLQKDGTKEVTYPNATVKTCFPDGQEEWVFQDGLVVKVDTKLGEKTLLLPNGQREIQNKDHMRREYPDGTVKTVYPDGIQETRYSNGRIRVKDKDGNLLMDSVMQRL
ncbi:centromere protein J [Periplaneta americana]|uniref:centromere protein J n=1 Tax=Periplaneta americana TaxID=6978 RepID=UPI0037E9911F